MEDLDSLVRRVDLDRWLATRFIGDAQARADVVAVYAFDHELSRVARVTSQALLGEIRLTWWSDAVTEIYEGRAARRHPVTLALADAVARHGLARIDLDAMIDARLPELDGQPADELRIATAAMRLTTTILGANGADIDAAAWAWGNRLPATLEKANLDLANLPARAFPAVAYATLVREGWGAPIGKRLRLAWAVLRGRL